MYYFHSQDPLGYSRWMTKRTVSIAIGLIWVLSALVSFLPIQLGLHRSTADIDLNATLTTTPQPPTSGSTNAVSTDDHIDLNATLTITPQPSTSGSINAVSTGDHITVLNRFHHKHENLLQFVIFILSNPNGSLYV